MLLRYRELKGYKYIVEESSAYNLPKLAFITFESKYLSLKDGYLIIKPGYAWDGASGPTRDDKSNMRGSLVHDALYQILREGDIKAAEFVRQYADELLRDICIADSPNKAWAKIRYGIWYRMVRRFAKRSSTSAQKPRGKVVEI